MVSNAHFPREPAVKPPILIADDLRIGVPPPCGCVMNTVELTGVEAEVARPPADSLQIIFRAALLIRLEYFG